MAAIGGVLAAFGLAAAAGLNAYIPLLIVALSARFTDWFKLGPAWDPLTSWWVIGGTRLPGCRGILCRQAASNQSRQRRNSDLCQASRRRIAICSQHQRRH